MSLAPGTIGGIAQISVRVRDIAAATAFYGDALGLPILFSQSDMAIADCHGVRLLLSIPESAEFDHPGSVVYFKVSDIHAAYDSLHSAGAEMRGKPHKVAEFGGFAVWMAFFYDPDRNLHALTSEIPIA